MRRPINIVLSFRRMSGLIFWKKWRDNEFPARIGGCGGCRTPQDKPDNPRGDEVKKIALCSLILLPLLANAQPDSTAPVKFLQAIVMPDVPKGPYSDHLAVDLQGHRLFATPQAQMSVQVIDYTTGKLVHTINGIKNPHSVLYRQDLARIYITECRAGALR